MPTSTINIKKVDCKSNKQINRCYLEYHKKRRKKNANDKFLHKQYRMKLHHFSFIMPAYANYIYGMTGIILLGLEN